MVNNPATMQQPRFTVVIRSHLGDYPGAASDRETKFNIALTSVLNQIITNIEVIVVSDGCEITNRIMETDPRFKRFKLIKLPKQKLHSGVLAQVAFDAATGEYICFLDTDDFFGLDHLFIMDYLLTLHKNPDFAYYDAYKYEPIDPQKELEGKPQEIMETKMEAGHIGNGTIVFKRSLNVRYDDIECSTFIPGVGEIQNYGHDAIFAKRCWQKAKTIAKLEGLQRKDRQQGVKKPLMPQYYVCHEPGKFDH